MTDLSITQQAIEDRQMLLTVQVPQARVDAAVRKEVARVAKNYRIPGFRPGKAPFDVVLRMVGRENIMAEVVEALGEGIYTEAVQAAELEPFGMGAIRDVKFDPLVFEIVVPLAPEVNIGDYRSLRVPYLPPSEEDIEAHVESDLLEMRERQRTWTPVERPVAYGDLITVSVKGMAGDEIIIDNDDWDLTPDADDPTLTAEFDGAFIGMAAGEEKTFEISFPADGNSPWAGKTAVFQTAVKAVKSQELPELDDEFAQAAGRDSIAEMRAEIAEHARETVEGHADDVHAEKVYETLLAQSTIVFPPGALEDEIDLMAEEEERMLRIYGIKSHSEVLKIRGITEEEYRQTMREPATDRLRSKLALNAIARAEQLQASDYELDQYLVEGLASQPETLERMRKQLVESPLYRAFITEQILRRKAGKLLMAIARGEEIPAPGEHPVAEPPAEDSDESEAPSLPEATHEATLAAEVETIDE